MPAFNWEAYLENILDVRSRFGIADVIVAELNGKIAGTVTLFLKAAHFTPEGWPEEWAGVRLLAVHPDYRDRGIGRALMEECIRRARNAGKTAIGLHTSVLMAVARRMYEKMGFQRAPEYDYHPAPDVVVMAYRLDL